MRKILLTLIFLPLFAFATTTNSVVVDMTTNKVIHGSLNDQEVSIASISKLMTIYTVLSSQQDLEEKLTVTANKTSNTKLAKGMRLTRDDLIELALVSSDNLAAITLAENYPGGMTFFVYQMNENAKFLGMRNTGFVEPTGLSPMNYSTVKDIVTLTNAVSQFKQVQEAAQTQKEVTEEVEGIKSVRIQKKSKFRHKYVTTTQQTITAHPTIKYFGKEGIITIKTGFTHAAGFCVTMLVRANDKLYTITVLGAKTKQERQRIVEASLKKIYNA